jgi:uridine phosphorylase
LSIEQKGRRGFCGPFVFFSSQFADLFRNVFSVFCTKNRLRRYLSTFIGFKGRVMNRDIDTNILIHPKIGRREKNLPGNGLLLVNPSEASLCHRQLRQAGGEPRPLFNSDLTVAAGQSFFVAGPAVGAPMAALSVEKLIALGAKRIVLFGWCGAVASSLKVGDIILPTEAKSGEGTSRYYPLPVAAAPAKNLRACLAMVFGDNNMRVQTGCVWSTDAVYREDRRMLAELNQKDKVIAVDMEFSALCTVASFRRIEFAAVLLVSDELSGAAWKPGFSSDIFLKTKAKALDVLLTAIHKFAE